MKRHPPTTRVIKSADKIVWQKEILLKVTEAIEELEYDYAKKLIMQLKEVQ